MVKLFKKRWSPSPKFLPISMWCHTVWHIKWVNYADLTLTTLQTTVTKGTRKQNHSFLIWTLPELARMSIIFNCVISIYILYIYTHTYAYTYTYTSISICICISICMYIYISRVYIVRILYIHICIFIHVDYCCYYFHLFLHVMSSVIIICNWISIV